MEAHVDMPDADVQATDLHQAIVSSGKSTPALEQSFNDELAKLKGRVYPLIGSGLTYGDSRDRAAILLGHGHQSKYDIKVRLISAEKDFNKLKTAVKEWLEDNSVKILGLSLANNGGWWKVMLVYDTTPGPTYNVGGQLHTGAEEEQLFVTQDLRNVEVVTAFGFTYMNDKGYAALYIYPQSST